MGTVLSNGGSFPTGVILTQVCQVNTKTIQHNIQTKNFTKIQRHSFVCIYSEKLTGK